MVCKHAWCPGCYKSPSAIAFAKVEVLDDDGLPLPNRDKDMFMTARAGDTMMTPFQCEFCLFQNIKGRDALEKVSRDAYMLALLRRANLDAFWARQRTTVERMVTELNRMRQLEVSFGMETNIPPRGPFPVKDTFGAGLAICMLQRSLDVGKNVATVQYNTARKLRSALNNAWETSSEAENELTFCIQGKHGMRTSRAVGRSYWYCRFDDGLHRRLGDQVVQDEAISSKVMVEMMKILETRFQKDASDCEVVEAGTFFLIAYLGGLRGNEVPMANLGAMRKLRKTTLKFQAEFPHAPVVLQGVMKSRSGTPTTHMFLLSCITRSGFMPDVLTWINRLIDLREKEGRTSGWLFAIKEGKDKGKPVRMNHYEDCLHDVLLEVQRVSELITEELDVVDRYHISRSFRRGATTEARIGGVSSMDIELNNRWRMEEKQRGKQANVDMVSLYTQHIMEVQLLTRFSRGL